MAVLGVKLLGVLGAHTQDHCGYRDLSNHICAAQSIKDVIGPQLDIPAPDMNTDGRVMSW